MSAVVSYLRVSWAPFSVLIIACLWPAALAQPAHPPMQLTLTHYHLSDLDRLAASYVETHQVPHFSYGVWQNGVLIREGFHGRASPRGDDALSGKTIHRIYSMTKPVTAVGQLILMERGYFELDDPLANYLPEFEHLEIVADYDSAGNLFTYEPLRGPTIRQLLNHTAGFANSVSGPPPLRQKLKAAKLTTSTTSQDLVSKTAALPLMNQPGAEWHYSIASDVQGALIEKLSGQSLSTFLEKEIFEPLGMQDTGFYLPPDKLQRASVVTHLTAHGLRVSKSKSLDQATQTRTYFEGGHGLASTLDDYRIFLEMLRRNGQGASRRILSPSSVAVLRSNSLTYCGKPGRQRRAGVQSGLGFGFGVATIEDPDRADMSAPVGTYYWHSALGSWFWVDPENDIVFVGMIQSETPLDPAPLNASMTSVYGARTVRARLTAGR